GCAGCSGRARCRRALPVGGASCGARMSTFAPLLFSRRLTTFAEEKVARPCVVERRVERVDSDEERLGLVEAAALHLRAGQEVHRPQGLRLVRVLFNDRAKPRLGLGEVAVLVSAERGAVGVALAARGGRGGGEGE